MLFLLKENIHLKVLYLDGVLWVVPLERAFDNASLLKALACNEELLAQVYLKQHPEGDTASLLTAYFRERGWQVSQQDPALAAHKEP